MINIKKIFLILLVLSTFFYYGCEGCNKEVKHLKSTWSGLNRKVTLYAYDGSIIKTWEGKFMVELMENVASWIDENNKEIKISGIFIIEEK